MKRVSPLLVLAFAAALHAQPARQNSPGWSLKLPDSFLPGRFSLSGLYRVREGVPGGNPVDLTSLFQRPGGGTPAFRFGNTNPSSSGKFNPRGRSAPSQSDSNLRLSSAASGFRLSGREASTLRGLPPNTGFGKVPAATGSTNSNFANGMFNLSTTTMYAGHPVTGSFGAGRSSTLAIPGSQKQSSPSVALKLSF